MPERRRASPTTERRTRPSKMLEMRAADGGQAGYHFTGYACATDEPYEMSDYWDTWTEVVRPGAFTKTLAESDDCPLLVNHDGLPLARNSSGTLTLAEDGTGLLSDAPALDPANPTVAEVKSAMDRRDLTQMSFAFQVTKQLWAPDFTQRDILEVKLWDVSIVTYPANPATSAELRSALAKRYRAPQARIDQLKRALDGVREGRSLSPAEAIVLSSILDALTQIDDSVDEAADALSTLLGVPDPTDPDEDETSAETDSMPAPMLRNAYTAEIEALAARRFPHAAARAAS